MPTPFADRVRETTITTGQNNLSLAGAEPGFRSFIDGIGDGNQCVYAIVNRAVGEWEVGRGVISAGAPNVLTRTSVYSNSNNDTAKVAFAAGVKDVFVTIHAGVALSDLSGSVAASQLPAFTGDVSVSAGTSTTVIGANKVLNSMLAGGIDLATKVTGILPAGNFPALTGDVTNTAGQVSTTIAPGAVSLSKQANLAANSIIGNNTGSAATPIALTVSQAKTLLSLNNVENTAISTWRLDQVAAPTASVSLNSQRLINVADPTAASDAATKNYVDIAIQGLVQKPTARLATTAALSANTYANGTSGLGATLTANANGTLSIDGAAVNVGDVVLIKDEGTASKNGLYTVTAAGSGGSAFVLTRHVDMDTSGEYKGAFTPIGPEGTVNNNSLWLNTNTSTVTVGTTSITFVQLNKATDLTQGAGISISGNTIAVATNGVSDSMLRQSAALSIIGRSANSTGNVADISAGADFNILRRSGTAIGFGSIDLSQSGAVGASILAIANGGTGSATKNFLDLTTDQTVAGAKIFTSNLTAPIRDKGGMAWDITAFGADKTGVAESTSAINAAITAAAGGDTITGPPGVYLIDKITAPSGKPISFLFPGESRVIFKAKSGATGPLLNFSYSSKAGAQQISGFAVDLSLATTLTGIFIDNFDTSVIDNIRVTYGATGISVARTGASAFRNLILRDQTTAAFSVNGDDSAELTYDDFAINCTTGSMAAGFQIVRTTTTDVGGHWLSRIKIIGAGITNGLKFSAASSAPFFVFGHDITSDQIGGGNALLLTNVNRARFTNCHFWSAHATLLGVKIDGGSKFEFVNCYAGGIGGVEFANSPNALQFANCTLEGTNAFKMPATNPPTNMIMGRNEVVNATSLTNDFDKLAVAAGATYTGGLQVLTSYNTGANATFSIRSASGHVFYIRGSNGGGIEFIGNDFSGVVALISNTGGFFGTAGSFTSGSHTGLTGLGIRDTSAAFDVTLAATSSTTLTAGRTLTVDVVNAARTLKLTGNPTIADWFDQSVKTTATTQFLREGIGAAADSAVPLIINSLTTGPAANANGVVITSANTSVSSRQGGLQIITNDSAAIDKGGSIGLGGYYNSTSNSVVFAGIAGRKENTTNNDFAGYLEISTVPAGGAQRAVARFSSDGGMQMGAPTGGSKGLGTINAAGDIYKNNSAYTNPDYVLEQWATGKIDRFKGNPGAEKYRALTLDQIEAFARKNYYLPQLDLFDAHREGAGIFSRADISLILHEDTYRFLFEQERRIKDLAFLIEAQQARIEALEEAAR